MPKVMGPKIQDAVVDIVCDRCGKSCDIPFSGYEGMNFNYVQLSGEWGFGTDEDGEYVETYICYDCWPDVKRTLESVGVKFDGMG